MNQDEEKEQGEVGEEVVVVVVEKHKEGEEMMKEKR